MKPICVPCQRFYRPKKNGFWFIEGMPAHGGVKPGREEADQWQNYKLWNGDLWECEGCGHQIISGVSLVPYARHHEPDFTAKISNVGATFRVNDC